MTPLILGWLLLSTLLLIVGITGRPRIPVGSRFHPKARSRGAYALLFIPFGIAGLLGLCNKLLTSHIGMRPDSRSTALLLALDHQVFFQFYIGYLLILFAVVAGRSTEPRKDVKRGTQVIGWVMGITILATAFYELGMAIR